MDSGAFVHPWGFWSMYLGIGALSLVPILIGMAGGAACAYSLVNWRASRQYATVREAIHSRTDHFKLHQANDLPMSLLNVSTIPLPDQLT